MTSFLTPTRISPALATLLGLADDTYTHSQITRRFVDHCRTKGLLPSSGDTLNLDNETRAAIGVPEGDRVGVLNIAGYLRPHLLDLPPIVPTPPEEWA